MFFEIDDDNSDSDCDGNDDIHGGNVNDDTLTTLATVMMKTTPAIVMTMMLFKRSCR